MFKTYTIVPFHPDLHINDLNGSYGFELFTFSNRNLAEIMIQCLISNPTGSIKSNYFIAEDTYNPNEILSKMYCWINNKLTRV